MDGDRRRSCSPWTACVARKHPHCKRPNPRPRLGMRECELVEGEERCFSHNTIKLHSEGAKERSALRPLRGLLGKQTVLCKPSLGGRWTLDAGGRWVARGGEGWGAGRLKTQTLIIPGALTPWPISTQHPARTEGINCRQEGNRSPFFSQENLVEGIAFPAFKLSEIIRTHTYKCPQVSVCKRM